MMARDMANTPEEVQKQRAAHYKGALKADGTDNAESLKDYMGTTDTFTLGWGFGSGGRSHPQISKHAATHRIVLTVTSRPAAPPARSPAASSR